LELGDWEIDAMRALVALDAAARDRVIAWALGRWPAGRMP
jgi:hypothetical protein